MTDLCLTQRVHEAQQRVQTAEFNVETELRRSLDYFDRIKGGLTSEELYDLATECDEEPMGEPVHCVYCAAWLEWVERNP